MKRISFAALLLLIISTVTFAQRIMKVEKTDGTTVEFPVTEVTRVYFEELTPKPDPNPDPNPNPDPVPYPYGLCPDTHHPHMIDLGIGVKWACCNVGASKPEEYGGYYSWGETTEKDYYLVENYTFSREENDGKSICGTANDAARVNWGIPWRLPTLAECQALADCSSEWITVNDIPGRKFTGPNGKSIFLPAAENRWNTGLYDRGGPGSYWTGTCWPGIPTLPGYLKFDISSVYCFYYDPPHDGLTVRPVSE